MNALGWGLVVGAALPLGAACMLLRLPKRATAAIVAFGSGALIAALSVVLMETAWEQGGLVFSALAFIVGAGAYTFADACLQRRNRIASELGSGFSIATG